MEKKKKKKLFRASFEIFRIRYLKIYSGFSTNFFSFYVQVNRSRIRYEILIGIWKKLHLCCESIKNFGSFDSCHLPGSNKDRESDEWSLTGANYSIVRRPWHRIGSYRKVRYLLLLPVRCNVFFLRNISAKWFSQWFNVYNVPCS